MLVKAGDGMFRRTVKSIAMIVNFDQSDQDPLVISRSISLETIRKLKRES